MQYSGCDRVENIIGKGENAGYQHFLLFPQSFQMTYFRYSHLKHVIALKVGLQRPVVPVLTKEKKKKCMCEKKVSLDGGYSCVFLDNSPSDFLVYKKVKVEEFE